MKNKKKNPVDELDKKPLNLQKKNREESFEYQIYKEKSSQSMLEREEEKYSHQVLD